MRSLIRSITFAFSAGAFGALINTFSIYFLGSYGLNAMLGVGNQIDLTPQLFYQRLVWGGVWGFLFILPLFKDSYYIYRGLIFSLLPTACQLFIVFPYMAKKGMLGLDLGLMTPLLILFYNAIWGFSVALWFDYTRVRKV